MCAYYDGVAFCVEREGHVDNGAALGLAGNKWLRSYIHGIELKTKLKKTFTESEMLKLCM